MLVRRGPDGRFDHHQFCVSCGEIDFLLSFCCADVAKDVQIEVVLLNLLHCHTAGITSLGTAVLKRVDDLADVLVRQPVLAFAFIKVFGSVDEQDVIRLLAFLERNRSQPPR